MAMGENDNENDDNKDLMQQLTKEKGGRNGATSDGGPGQRCNKRGEG